MFRYLVGLLPTVSRDYFDIGSAYHALMEGQPGEKVAAEYPQYIEVARELEATRRKGPPLGKAHAVETVRTLFGGLMTVKPDREENGVMRDYKSAATFREKDEDQWNVDPAIIGEMMGAKVERGIVDIVSKRIESKSNRVKLVQVKLTAEKASALEQMVKDLWEQLALRLKAMAKGAKLEETFPPNLYVCATDYGCDYYERCWGKPPESLLYAVAPQPPRRWVHGDEKVDLELPNGLTVTVIEKAADKAYVALNLKRKS